MAALSFFQSSTSLFNILLYKNDIAVSKSNLALLIMYNIFAITKWKILLLSSSNCCAYSLTINRWLDSGVVTFSSIFSPNAYTSSNNCSFTSISTFFSFVIFIFIPKILCFFNLVITNSPNFFFKNWLNPLLILIPSGTLCYLPHITQGYIVYH